MSWTYADILGDTGPGSKPSRTLPQGLMVLMLDADKQPISSSHEAHEWTARKLESCCLCSDRLVAAVSSCTTRSLELASGV